MKINTLNCKEYIKELRRLRIQLAPILNGHFAEVLEDAERRITTGGVSISPDAVQKKTRKRKTPTKQELFNKYYYM